jgi:hypothetical protein
MTSVTTRESDVYQEYIESKALSTFDSVAVVDVTVVDCECGEVIPVGMSYLFVRVGDFVRKVAGSFVKEFLLDEFSPLVWEVSVADDDACWSFSDEFSEEWLGPIAVPDESDALTDDEWLRMQVLQLFDAGSIEFNNRKAREHEFSGTWASDLRNE